MADATTALAAFSVNALYALRGSTAMCEAFLQACADLLVLLPEKQSRGGSSAVEFGVNLFEISRLKAQAEQWYAANVAGMSQVVHADFRGMRD